MPRAWASVTSRSKSASGAEARVDRSVVGDVVAEVVAGGGVDRREPDGIHAERVGRAVVQVVEVRE